MVYYGYSTKFYIEYCIKFFIFFFFTYKYINLEKTIIY